jgi:hypothetical protein
MAILTRVRQDAQRKIDISLYHLRTFPVVQLLQNVQGCSVFNMPTGPGMPYVLRSSSGFSPENFFDKNQAKNVTPQHAMKKYHHSCDGGNMLAAENKPRVWSTINQVIWWERRSFATALCRISSSWSMLYSPKFLTWMRFFSTRLVYQYLISRLCNPYI